jgi:glycosyltransferase involved in cell wall biosynthesis
MITSCVRMVLTKFRMKSFNNIAEENYLKTDRQPGISFIVRCRNEQKYIEKSITSLKKIKVPYEIVVILHNCNDDSKSIAERLKSEGYPIRTFEYTTHTSKAGIETLVTPMNHPNSLMTYYNFCFSKARYNWVMKWDADFKSTKPLIDFINNKLDLSEKAPIRYQIRCKLGLSRIIHREPYLTNALAEYYKYYFWEVPAYSKKFKEINLDNKISIKSISTKKIKQYWHDKPWFMDKNSADADLTKKYNKAIEILKPEPLAMARASNKEMNEIFYLVRDNENELNKSGVFLTK